MEFVVEVVGEMGMNRRNGSSRQNFALAPSYKVLFYNKRVLGWLTDCLGESLHEMQCSCINS
jgi:hypothetical protein